MSIFIASLAFKERDFLAAKIAIFMSSFAAALLGVLILWRHKTAVVSDTRTRHHQQHHNPYSKISQRRTKFVVAGMPQR